MSERSIRVVIDEAAFRALVAGQAASLRTADGLEVEAILSDIGWAKMVAAFDDALATAFATKLGPLC